MRHPEPAATPQLPPLEPALRLPSCPPLLALLRRPGASPQGPRGPARHMRPCSPNCGEQPLSSMAVPPTCASSQCLSNNKIYPETSSGLERWTAGGGEAAAETLMKDILRLPVGTPQPRQRDREQGADRQRGSCASCIEELRARPVWGLLLISSSVGGLSVPVRWEKANPSQSSLSGSNWRTGFTPGSKTLPPPSPWGLKFHH